MKKEIIVLKTLKLRVILRCQEFLRNLTPIKSLQLKETLQGKSEAFKLKNFFRIRFNLKIK